MSTSSWDTIREDLLASTKQRLSGLESLEALLKRTSLGRSEVGELLDLSPSLLSDANSKVAQQTLEALRVVVQRQDIPLTPYLPLLVPSVAERLGDSRQPVREQALLVLVSLFKALKPELVLDKLAPLWHHKSWKVKHGLLEVIAEVVSTTGASSFLGGRDQNNAVLKQIVRMMEEPDMTVREAAQGCLEEIYRQVPAAVVSAVQASSLRPERQREVFSRLGADTAPTDVGPAKRTSASGTPAVESASSSGGGAYYAVPDFAAAASSAADAAARVSGSGAAGSSGSHDGTLPSRPATTDAQTRRPGAATAWAGPAAVAPAAKRGGFKDGGGVTADGDLPAAVPIHVSSERELRTELEAATAILAQAPNADWTARMTAMQRVEGLVLGGALEWDCFNECIKGVAQALSQQFKERRSSIARQACHLIGVLSRHMGPRFEPYALLLLPTLLGVLIITVAVMAESADVGVRGMLGNCQTPRLVQAISDGVVKEKNPKSRQFCVGYLVMILEEWDVSVWSRALEGVEAAIRAAAQDSTGETRASARAAMALYHSAAPDRAQAFLRRLDGGLQDKLAVAVGGGRTVKPAPSFSRQSIKVLARQASVTPDPAADELGIVVMVPGSKPSPRHPETAQQQHNHHHAETSGAPRPRAAAGRASNVFAAPPPLGASGSEAAHAVDTRPLTAAAGRTSRKSLGMPPGRIPGGSADLTGLLAESSSSSMIDPGTQARAAALRRPRVSALPYDLPQRVPAEATSSASRVPCAPAAELQPSRPPVAPAPPPPPGPSVSVRASSGSWPKQDRQPHQQDRGAATPVEAAPAVLVSAGLVPLSRVVTAILGGPRTWSEKVDALAAMSAHVRASVPSGTFPSASASGSDGTASSLAAEPDKVAAALERVRERLMEALEDPHQKVLAAALALAGEAVRHYGRVLEGQLDRLLPILLNKGAEHKEALRVACADVLSECGEAYRPDVLLPALSKCLDVVKQPRGRQAALDFFRVHVAGWGHVPSAQLKQWLVRLAPLLEDRTPELRKRAGEVMEELLAVAWAREPINYVAYQHNSADVAPLRRYLSTQHPSALAIPSASAAASNGTSGLFGPSSQHQQQQQHLTVSGAPPATIGDNRRQLPSNAPVPCLTSLPPSVAAYRGSSSGGGSSGQSYLPAVAVAAAGTGLEDSRMVAAAAAGPSSGLNSMVSADGGGYLPRPRAGASPQMASQQQHQHSSLPHYPVGGGGARLSADGVAQPHMSLALPAQPGAHRSSAPGGQSSSAPYPGPGHGAALTTTSTTQPPPFCSTSSSHAPPALPPPAPAAAPFASISFGTIAGTATAGSASSRRPLQVPSEPSAQLAFLAQLLDVARAAVGGAVPTSTAGGPGAAPGVGLSIAPVPGGATPDQQTAAMEDLADAVERCGREAWVRTFPLLMVEISSWVRHSARSVRAMALALLKELLAHQPQLFTEAALESQMGLLLAGCGDVSREVSMTGAQALRSLLATCNEQAALLLLQQALPRERELHRRAGDKGARLVVVLDGIRQLAARLERPELHRLAFTPSPLAADGGAPSTLLEALVGCLADPETSVRRGAVVTLADLWYRLGHGVRDVLQVLASSSFNLLCIYYLKLQGVTVAAGEDNPTEHPLVLGGALRAQQGVM